MKLIVLGIGASILALAGIAAWVQWRADSPGWTIVLAIGLIAALAIVVFAARRFRAGVHAANPPRRYVRRWLGIALRLIGVSLFALAGVVLVRTAMVHSRQLAVPPVPGVAVDELAAAQRLAGAIRIATVSHVKDDETDRKQIQDLIAYLKQTYPKVSERLRWEVIGEGNPLITWEGRDKSLKPLLLTAHMDVVPAVGPGPVGQAFQTDSPRIPWKDLAFQGLVDENFIWGRGTLDDKVSVLGILEATETLLNEGFTPGRTLLLAFGRDEEVGGQKGAMRIAAELKRRNIAPECVLDEGSSVLEGVVPGLSTPVAPVGIAEKGFVDIELAVEAEGGHSSMPPPHTAIGILSRAIARVEDHPLPPRIDGVTRRTLDALAPELPFGPRLLFANYWLFGGLLKRELAQSPAMNALIRTTTAVTLINGGTKDNVLPGSASAIVNFRVLPGDTSASLLEHVERAVADPRVKVRFADPQDYGAVHEPSRVSPSNSAAYTTIETTIRQTFPNTVVVPFLVLAGTDARHYEALTDNIYRFLPIRLGPRDLDRIHGAYERIARKDYVATVRFYYNLMRNFDGH